MRKKAILGILVSGLLAMGVLGGCMNTVASDAETKQTIKVVDRTENEVEVTKNPERVVVLDYGTLDILDELDVESTVVGVPQNGLPSYLEEFKDEKYTNIGGVKEFNFETINELNPDLIIIEGRQADSLEELSKIAPTVYLGSEGSDYMNRLKANLDVIGDIFDKKDAVNEKLTAIEDRIKAINEKVISENLDATFAMVVDGSMSVFGQGSRYNFLFNELGFRSTDESIEVSNHGQSISFEYLADKNPSYLFVVDKGEITGSNTPAKDIVENEIVKNTDTYKNGNIVYLNSQAWYVGGAGFKAVDTMISDVENALNK